MRLVTYENKDWRSGVSSLRAEANLAICDPVYSSRNLDYIEGAWEVLRPGGGIYVFGDHSRIAETKLALDKQGFQFRNWLIWGPNDWGGRSKTKWPQKHDDILYYVKPGAEPTFRSERVQIPKKMTQSAFNPSGRTGKTPSSVWVDLAGFHTNAKERVRIDGVCVRWQKPVSVITRIILASSDPGDLIWDPFGGVATVPAVAEPLGRRCRSYEIDAHTFAAGQERLNRDLG